MIGQAIRHGRTTRDARNLGAHLLKDAGTRIEMFNSVAPDIYAAMSDMQLARDGSRADSAFLHLSISPARNMNDDELRQVADIVIRHFGAEDHQAAFVIHDKDRSNNKGNSHGHIVLGRVGPDGQVISSGFEKIKLETAMRIAEFELGESATLGRHHGSAIKWLQANGREDVANWLETSLGPNPDKPQSPMSPVKRQQIERVVGTDLTTVMVAVRTAWDQSDSAKSFTAALHETGLDVIPGQKSGVFVVSQNGVELGALDRLLKEKRRVVVDRMKGFNDEPDNKDKPNAGNESYLSRSKLQQERDRSIEATTPIVRDTREVGRGADRTNSAVAGSDPTRSAALDDYDRGYRQKGRKLDENQTLITLDQIRLSSSTVVCMQEIKVHHKPFSLYELHSAAIQLDNHKSGWDWVQTFREDLLDKIRELKEKVTSLYKQPKTIRLRDEYEIDAHEEDDNDYEPPRFG